MRGKMARGRGSPELFLSFSNYSKKKSWPEVDEVRWRGRDSPELFLSFSNYSKKKSWPEVDEVRWRGRDSPGGRGAGAEPRREDLHEFSW